MPKSKPASAAALDRHRHTQFTTEAFRELAESAIEELYENSDAHELHDMRSWSKKLTRSLASVADYRDGDLSSTVVGDANE